MDAVARAAPQVVVEPQVGLVDRLNNLGRRLVGMPMNQETRGMLEREAVAITRDAVARAEIVENPLLPPDSVYVSWVADAGMPYTTSSTSLATTWRGWAGTTVGTGAIGAASTYGATTDPFPAWSITAGAAGTAATSTITINATYRGWVNAQGVERLDLYTRRIAPIAVESPDERTARLAREEAAREAYRRQEDQRREQRRVAILKADKLLESVLNSAQRDMLKKHQYFLTKSKSGKMYRIRQGRSINVDVLDDKGKVLQTLCAYPTGNVPDGDAMVAQKLMLECDEEEFLRIAIKHPASHAPAVPREALAMLH